MMFSRAAAGTSSDSVRAVSGGSPGVIALFWGADHHRSAGCRCFRFAVSDASSSASPAASAAARAQPRTSSQRLGADVVDTDAIAHELTAAGGAAIPDAARAVRPDVLERRAPWIAPRSAQRVFADPVARRTLEAMLHPMIRERIASGASRRGRGTVRRPRGAAARRIGRLSRARRARAGRRLRPRSCRSQRVRARSGLGEDEVRAHHRQPGTARRATSPLRTT